VQWHCALGAAGGASPRWCPTRRSVSRPTWAFRHRLLRLPPSARSTGAFRPFSRRQPAPCQHGMAYSVKPNLCLSISGRCKPESALAIAL
jgi:hypothetical protein